MKLEGENVLLRIFINVFQRWHHHSAYEAIVERAHKEHMAGATVLEGLEGFGLNGVILKERAWRIANDREVIVEIVDTKEKIDSFLALIEPMLQDAIVTLERACVIYYRHNGDQRS